jgi:hypothetical protein
MSQFEIIMDQITKEYKARTQKSYLMYQQAKEVFPGGDTRNVTFLNPIHPLLTMGRAVEFGMLTVTK